MVRRPEIAVRGPLEELADVDDEGPVEGRRVDPAAGVLHLEPALAGLDEEEGEHAGVLVRPHPLAFAVLGTARVADELDESLGTLPECRVEDVCAGAETHRPFP